jgi:hypothetical protein
MKGIEPKKEKGGKERNERNETKVRPSETGIGTKKRCAGVSYICVLMKYSRKFPFFSF